MEVFKNRFLSMHKDIYFIPTECLDCGSKLTKDKSGEMFCSKCGLII